jgi:hypothetical protein
MIAADCDREAHLFEGEQTACNLRCQMATGINGIQNTPAPVGRRVRASAIEARKNPRNRKTEDPYFLDRHACLYEDLRGWIVRHQEEVAVRAMPN